MEPIPPSGGSRRDRRTPPRRLLGGVAAIPLVRQPNGYTCGPACVRMVLSHLDVRPDLTVDRLADLMGTNPRTGTTEVEMARGMAVAGLAAVHPAPEASGGGPGAAAYLRDVLKRRELVLLRTLIGGCKHWVVVHGFDDRGGFLVACPSLGARRWQEDFLLACWGARQWDHFRVAGLSPKLAAGRDADAATAGPTAQSAVPSAPPAADVASEASTGAPIQGWRPVHEMDLSTFLSVDRIVPDRMQTAWHRGAIAEAARRITSMGSARAGTVLDYGAGSNFTFRAVRFAGISDMTVLENGSGRVAGGIFKGLRWVHPAFRGAGLGAGIALAAHSVPGLVFLRPSSYSEGGWHSRVAAHRLAVRRAIDAGLRVPSAVLAEYLSGPPEIPSPGGSGAGRKRRDDAGGRQLRLL